MNKSHLTAIKRKTLSLPMQWLVDNGHIKKGDNGLDYGCGRGDDADALYFAGYDPHHRNVDLNAGGSDKAFFDVVTCNYVLNVIEDKNDRFAVECNLIFRARRKAFISVRNDIKLLNGHTSKGTWQGVVEPESKKWKLIETNAKFKMWMYNASTECEGE